MNKKIFIILIIIMSRCLVAMEQEASHNNVSKKKSLLRKLTKSSSNISLKKQHKNAHPENLDQGPSPEEIAAYIENETQFPNGDEEELVQALKKLQSKDSERYKKITQSIESLKNNLKNSSQNE